MPGHDHGRRRVLGYAAGLALSAIAPRTARAQGAATITGPQPVITPLQPLEIVTRNGVISFAVEFAQTDEQRTIGLMFRASVPDGQGMLFDFRSEQEVGMWMKNTLIPLDMLFIRSDGRIHRIAENTEPHSLRTIASFGPVRAVLELAGGSARRLGIAPGDVVSHRLFAR
jgi:uncharacterized membrane protein (UPF0127 family)